MTTELLNKIIQYLIKRPYEEVYEIMDELRKVIEDHKNAQNVENSVDEECEGDSNGD